MRDAVIVSTARTPIGRAYRGAFNLTPGASLGALSVEAAVARAGIEGGEVDDVLWGAALQQGAQAGNIARQVALRAGLPVTVSGMSLDRQCASGLMAIATAAKQVVMDRMDIVVAGGQESISLVQTKDMRVQPDPSLVAMHNAVYMPMLQTAEVVANRYNIPRSAMDEGESEWGAGSAPDHTKICEIHSASSAGFSSPSISTDSSTVCCHWPGRFSAISSSLKWPRTRFPARTGVRKRTLFPP